MNTCAEQLRLFLVAWQFLTRIPLGERVEQWVDWNPQRLRASSRYFSLVGVVIGALAAVTFTAAAQLFDITIAALITVAITALATGAFHEDGFADYFDSFGGTDRVKALAIMKDSRIGTFGALALGLLVLFKAAALSQMSIHIAVAALIASHALGRAGACALMRALDYVREDDSAKSKPLAEKMSAGELFVALCIGVMPLLFAVMSQWISLLHAIVTLTAVAMFVMLFARHLRVRLGGFTGDTLGAAEQAIELIVLLALASRNT